MSVRPRPVALWFAPGVIVVLVLVAIAVHRLASPAPSTVEAPVAVPSAPVAAVPEHRPRPTGTLPALAGTLAVSAPSAAPVNAVVDLPNQPPMVAAGPTVRVDPQRALVRIDGRPLSPADVFPDVSGSELVVAKDELDARIARAIDRELTLAAARAAGLDPDAETAAQLARVRARQARAAERMAALGAEWSSATEKTMEFEARDLAATTLQQRLMAGQGSRPAGAPDPEAARQFLASLRQKARIETLP